MSGLRSRVGDVLYKGVYPASVANTTRFFWRAGFAI
jgi:hypothetical protein